MDQQLVSALNLHSSREQDQVMYLWCISMVHNCATVTLHHGNICCMQVATGTCGVAYV